jgi:hypothetical protein
MMTPTTEQIELEETLRDCQRFRREIETCIADGLVFYKPGIDAVLNDIAPELVYQTILAPNYGTWPEHLVAVQPAGQKFWLAMLGEARLDTAQFVHSCRHAVWDVAEALEDCLQDIQAAEDEAAQDP